VRKLFVHPKENQKNNTAKRIDNAVVALLYYYNGYFNFRLYLAGFFSRRFDLRNKMKSVKYAFLKGGIDFKNIHSYDIQFRVGVYFISWPGL